MKRKWLNFTAVFVFFYCLLGIPSLYYIVKAIFDDYYYQIGRIGVNILSNISKDLKITDADLKRLKNLPYERLPSDKTHIQVEQAFAKSAAIIQASNIYLIVKLNQNDIVKYAEESYSSDNGMYVFNIFYGSDDFKIENTANRRRLISMSPELSKLYDQKETTHLSSADQTNGKFITSYIPFYTSEGTFSGILGIDIYNVEYMSFIRKLKIYFIAAPLAIFFMVLFSGITYLLNKEKATLLKTIAQKIVLDPLTGIYNRNGLEDFEKNNFLKLKEIGHFITVIMMDVDDFKSVNDNCGHDAGDEVLLGISKIIRENVRMPNDYPIRLGGDEFMVIFTNISRDLVISIANRLMRSIHASRFLANNIAVSVSIGVSTSSDKRDDKSLGSLMKEADLALYIGKKRSKNVVIAYESWMSEGETYTDNAWK